MSTRIAAVATSYSAAQRGLFARGARRLSDAAARSCLAHARCKSSDLDLLISVGLYKEHGLAEPALASMIQDDVGANTGKLLHHPLHGHGTFSFDIMNGGCGVLSALHVLDGFVSAGTAHAGLIVAADVDPEPGTSRGYRFPAAGGALLVLHDASGREGFTRFAFQTFPEDGDLFAANIAWDEASSRNVLTVDEHVMYAHRCSEHALEVARALLSAAALHPSDIDLLIASQHPARFATDLARALGLSPHAAPPIDPRFVRAHTAGPIAALDAAFTYGRLAEARRVLFVTAGAGITIGAALYERHLDPSSQGDLR